MHTNYTKGNHLLFIIRIVVSIQRLPTQLFMIFLDPNDINEILTSRTYFSKLFKAAATIFQIVL